jgi:alpha-L-rhamnosidase
MVMGLKVGDELRQEVQYTLKVGQQDYQPTFTAHGFRYVKVDNWPETVLPQNFTAVAVYSDLRQTGHFECSHPAINQLVQNTLWSQKGNFMDIPTDCPTRERAGWTGDIAIFCETGSYLMDTRRFLSKWMKDLALQQSEDGCVPNIVPSVGVLESLNGSAGWGDAAVVVPYTLYRMYDDEQILSDQYESMKDWLSFVEDRARQSSLINRLRGIPRNRYLVDTGYHWGEWLEPGHVMVLDTLKNMIVPDAEVATAYFAYSAALLSEIAAALEKQEDAIYYRDLSDQVKAAYRQAFTRDGLVESDRQARYVRPVALDLLPEADKIKNVERLNQMVISNHYRIGTGFLTTPFILPVLSDYGYVDTAYRMVENTERPGWLYAISKGATTIWENWNGINDRGVPHDSLNHYAFGAVTGWFFSHVAGITPLEPGFSRIRIKPTPGGSLKHAQCRYESAAGLISSSWRVDGENFTLDIETPSETEVYLPDGTHNIVQSGQYHWRV